MSDSTSVMLDAPVGADLKAAATRRTPSTLRRFLGSSVLGAVSLVLLLIVVTAAVGAEALAPYDPIETDYGALSDGPSRDHLLGTDSLGRDVLSRLIFGARVTLIVGFSS